MKTDSKEVATHDKMATMKDWFLDKCKDMNNALFTLDNTEVNRRLAPMLTPNNIPTFTIPIPNEETEYMNGIRERGHHGSDGELDKTGDEGHRKHNHWSTDNLAASLPVSPGFLRNGNVSLKGGKRDRSSSFHGNPSEKGTNIAFQSSHSKSCRTCPTSPCRSPDINGLDKHTNVDPMSVAAMTLDHFKAQTTYGFETLREMPHTRRKESLYFIQDGIDAKGHDDSNLSRSTLFKNSDDTTRYNSGS